MLYPFLDMGKIAALRRRRNYLLYKDRLKESINDDWDQLDTEIWVGTRYFVEFDAYKFVLWAWLDAADFSPGMAST